MRVVAIDYGRARTGLAVSDETGLLARPVGVVEKVRTQAGREALLARLAELEPERIVVGLPLTLSGERGEQAKETLGFVSDLVRRTDVPVETYDERFTTTLATRGHGRHPTDAVAAAHLLEGYLQRLAG
jgi:putative Holliday junction resolvase